MGVKLVIKQTGSQIGTKPKQRATLRALGLRRINAERVHDDNMVIRGMIDKVKHLLDVRIIQE